MGSLISSLVNNRLQYGVLVVLMLIFIGFIGILNSSNELIFERFLGNTSPLGMAVMVSIFGIAAFSLLLPNKRFVVYKKKKPTILLRYFLPIALFVSISIIVDWQILYPAEMNILYPDSLLFYPAIGFLVEILFHIVPLTILLFVFTSFFKTTSYQKLVWAVIFIIAALEPTYQIYMDAYPTWAILAVWVDLYVFNVFQLIVFRRFDFISMYALRLVYYLFWHIIWGSMRLELLF
ncbi:MAG: hypothetical protein ACR2MT_07635 [Aurantibacter sp.]